MKKQTFKDTSATDLTKLIAEKRTALRDFRSGLNAGKSKNVKLGRTLRKEIARALTVLGGQKQ